MQHLDPNECLDAPLTGRLECYSFRELSKEGKLLKNVSAPERFVCLFVSLTFEEATISHACFFFFFESCIQILKAPSFQCLPITLTHDSLLRRYRSLHHQRQLLDAESDSAESVDMMVRADAVCIN